MLVKPNHITRCIAALAALQFPSGVSKREYYVICGAEAQTEQNGSHVRKLRLVLGSPSDCRLVVSFALDEGLKS